MIEGIKCQNCGKSIPEDMVFSTDGKTLCEDCYIDVGHRIRVCDPWGERSKRIFRDSHGLEGTDGLTDLQKDLKTKNGDLAKAKKVFNTKKAELVKAQAILKGWSRWFCARSTPSAG